ncbi:MAG TPA: aldo/keto reductase [Candidatus Desulfaltia sp.]|nr:aldo/keto reductase [Candidatus Desulfaltia sp.]
MRLTTRLGDTGLTVSRLCYGTEPFTFKKGPEGAKTQGDVPPPEGGRRLAEAYRLGVNFWDTSDDYGTHPHVAEGLKLVPRGEVVVADKTNAHTYEEGVKAVELSLRDLGTDYVDIMFLHIVPPRPVEKLDASDRPYVSGPLSSRMGALRAFLDAKETGRVRATALSTHSTETLRQVLEVPEIDVVCTTLNVEGAYVDDGTQEDRIAAIRDLYDAGKFVYVIKILQAGRLRARADEAIRYVLQFHGFIDAWNIGMYDAHDVERDLRLLREALG